MNWLTMDSKQLPSLWPILPSAMVVKANPGVWVILWAQQRDQISRALKTMGNTPKSELIFHSTFID